MLNVKGIGKTRATSLIRHFKTLKALQEASVDEFCLVKGMNRPAAEALYNFYHVQNKKKSE